MFASLFQPLSAGTVRAAASAAVALGMFGVAADAGATQINGDIATFTVSDGIEAGQAPVNGPDVYTVDVAVVGGQSVWKLQTDSPIRLVSGACTRISGTIGVAGPSEIHCKRADAPGESQAVLGGGDDRFVAAPGFPDRLRLVGGDGNDTLVGGVADDVLHGGDGDNTLTGAEGNDRLTLGDPPRTQQGGYPNGNNTLTGGPGNDFIFGADGDDTVDGGDGNDSLGGGRGVDTLLGGEGDDTVNGTEDAFQKRDALTGGGGTDAFAGDVLDQIFARDGVAERISCSPVRFLTDPLAFTEVDLKDIIEFGDVCTSVLRAPKDETPTARPSAGTVKVSGRSARVKVSCAVGAACTGTLTVQLAKKKAATATAQFAVPAGSTKTVTVKLGRSDAAKVTTKGVRAVVATSEAGVVGARTVTQAVKLKR